MAATIKTIKKARLVPIPRICGHCGHEVQAGESYRYFQKYMRPIQFRCMLTGCTPRQSQLESNDKMADIYAAQEGLQDDIWAFGKDETREGLEALREALEQAANSSEEVADQFGEAADNLEEHFPDSQQVDDLREKQETCETWQELLRDLELDDFPEIEEDADTEKLKVAVENWASDVTSIVEAAMAELTI